MLPPVDLGGIGKANHSCATAVPKNVNAVLTRRRLLYFTLFPNKNRSFIYVELYVVKKPLHPGKSAKGGVHRLIRDKRLP